MRRLLLLATIMLIPSAGASAQALDPASPCWSLATKGEVVITRTDGTSVKDTVLCIGRDQVVLAKAGSIAIDTVRQISKPRDGVWDGVLKGASVGLFALVLCMPDCPAEPILRITAGYAVVGAAIDAAQGNNMTIFKRGAPSLGFRVRF
jgi:hypothetical protein